MAGFTEAEKLSLKELKSLRDQELIDDEALKRLRESIFIKLLGRNKVEEAVTASESRAKGTPPSAQLVNGESTSEEESMPGSVGSASSNSSRTVHVTATLKANVPAGKRLKTVHDSAKPKQVSLFKMGVTSRKEMSDGSSMLVTDDGNAFIADNYEPALECDVCSKKFSWPPALAQHKKSHKAAKPKKEAKCVNEMVPEIRVRLSLAPNFSHGSSKLVCLNFITAETLRPETNDERAQRLSISFESSQHVTAARKRDREARELEEEEAEAKLAGEESDDEAKLDDGGRHHLGRRGSAKRAARSFVFKKRVLAKLHEYEAAEVFSPFKMTACHFNISKSCVTKWKKNKEHILKQCKERKLQCLTKRQFVKQKGKWQDVQNGLSEWVRSNRQLGKAVSMLAVRLECRRLFMRLRPEEYEAFKCSHHWMRNFLTRHKFSIRRKTNGKTLSVEARIGGIKRFHARLRMRLVKDQVATNCFDTKWGAYRPQNRYSADQVPLPLANPISTLDDTGTKRVWIAGTKNDDSAKRFCTLQVVVRLKNEKVLEDGTIKSGTQQPKLTICFRGTGQRIAQAERDQWHPEVNVMFQRKAWFDEKTCVDWAVKHFSQDVEEVDGDNLVFLDNLDGQTRPAFKNAMKEACNSACHYLTAGCTDEIQVVDGGVGKAIKQEIVILTEKKLLEDEPFFQRWTNGGMSAMHKRIFVTHVGYQAYTNVMKRFDVEKVAIRTGCLMTINGQGDEDIKPEGSTAYSFSPSDAERPVQNKKGDFNEVAEENEAGVIGEEEEIVEASDVEQEEEESSSEEEEEVLQVSHILSCHYVGGTIKYVCQYQGYSEDDTSLEPMSNIQPKSVLLQFQEQGKLSGTFPPPKPASKRKKSDAGPSNKRSKASASGAYHTRAGLKLPSDWKIGEAVFDGSTDDEADADKSKADALQSKADANMAMDLCDSDASPLKAPPLVAGVCDYGCPNPDECLLKEATGRLCDHPGCSKRVHHLCLIEFSENKKKPLWCKKNVDKWSSAAMCKRHVVQKVAAAERDGSL